MIKAVNSKSVLHWCFLFHRRTSAPKSASIADIRLDLVEPAPPGTRSEQIPRIFAVSKRPVAESFRRETGRIGDRF